MSKPQLSSVPCARTHPRHLSTYCAAVSSVSFPSGTAFSNHISSWMTATASLTCTETQRHNDRESFGSPGVSGQDECNECIGECVSLKRSAKMRHNCPTGRSCVTRVCLCAEDIHEHPSGSAAQSHLSLLSWSTQASRSWSLVSPERCKKK